MEGDAYTSFAQVYDLFMDNVPYEDWCGYLCRTFRAHGIKEGVLVELGCGTGKLTRLMQKNGYELVGADCSADMLAVAANEPGDILWLQQDMRELTLDGAVAGMYSACDCVNYILEEAELSRVFERVHRYLLPGGLFVFDMNTPYKYRKLLADNTFAENRDEGSFIWENYFDGEALVNIYDLTLFIPDGRGRFRKFEEEHCQKCYEIGLVLRLLEQSGFETVAVRDGYTDEPLGQESERALFVAKRRPQCGQ